MQPYVTWEKRFELGMTFSTMISPGLAGIHPGQRMALSAKSKKCGVTVAGNCPEGFLPFLKVTPWEGPRKATGINN